MTGIASAGTSSSRFDDDFDRGFSNKRKSDYDDGFRKKRQNFGGNLISYYLCLSIKILSGQDNEISKE